jgi:catechol 2,3-dioxygenase-like lactoylglutathione lyase family enzyme
MEFSDIAIPILPSRSIADTVAFYTRLGFSGDAHELDQNYAILTRDSIELHFFLHDTLDPAQCYAGCYIRVTDVASLYQAFAHSQWPQSGIPRMVPLEDKPWGMREFALVDLDGNLLRIGQVIDE